jgi:hypothetical protein
MSKITQLERTRVGTLGPLLEGGYVESSYQRYLWRCDLCGLVWDRKDYAQGCAERGHRASFEQGPYVVATVENGESKPFRGGTLRYVTRRAVRRDRVPKQR